MLKKILFTIIALNISLITWATDYTTHKLPNGQTLIIQEIHNNPIVTIDTWIRTGSINETETNNGVAHFLEHLFFKGTKKYPPGEFDKILESKGAIVNAATSKDFTHYYITIPSEHFDTALDIHSDMLINPQIPRKELEKERKVVLEEISRSEDMPAKITYENLISMLYTNHPYKRKVLGSSDVISTIRREEILEFFNDYYIPSNMTTVIVGDINTEKVLQKVSSAFNSEFKKPIKKTYKADPALSTQKKIINFLNTQSGYMMIGFKTTDILDNQIYALEVLSKILGDGKSSKLYKNIQEQKGLAFSVSSYNSNNKDAGIFYIGANFTPTNPEKLEKAIFEEIDYIQKYGITEEELNTAKKTIEQETFYSRETTSDISSEIGYIATLTGDTDLYDNYINNIKKVSVDDVKKVAQKFLGRNKAAISIVLPTDYKLNETKTKQIHNAQKISESNGTIKYVIDNNATLLINKHDNNDIIGINILAKGGEFLENVPGEGTLLSQLLLSGTNKYSVQEITQLMEENGIKINPSCKEDFFSIDIQTTTSQIDLAMELLDEILNNTIINEKELEKKRTEILNKIKQKRDIPMNIASENFNALIYENSVYSHNNAFLEKTIPNVTKKNVLDYYNKIFDAKNIVISINGNVDTNNMINNFGAIFKDKKQPKFNYSDYKVTKITSPKIVSENIKNIQTSWLYLGWPTCGINNTKDFVTLKIINTILGGGMSSRLFKNLREQDGLAYQLGSSYSAKALGGIFVTYIGTNPESLNYSKNKIKLEVERLKMEFVSDNELQDAKNRLKGGFLIALETNSAKATTEALFENYGLGFNFYEKYIKMIEEVTASDIIRVANQYLNNIYVESTVK